MTENAELPLMTEKNETHERMPPKLSADPIDNTDPTDPIERIEPAEPIDRIDPLDPIDNSDPEDREAREERQEWDVDSKRRDRGMTHLEPFRACGNRPRHPLLYLYANACKYGNRRNDAIRSLQCQRHHARPGLG